MARRADCSLSHDLTSSGKRSKKDNKRRKKEVEKKTDEKEATKLSIV